jgi:hypothetical protein
MQARPADDKMAYGFESFLSVNDCVNGALIGPGRLSRDFFHNKGFNLIAFFDIIVFFEDASAFKSGFNFLDVILETLQGCKESFVYDNTVTNKPDL